MFFFLTFYEPWCPRVTVASGVLRLEQGECCGFVPCLKTIKQKSNESAYFLLLLFKRVNNEMTDTNNKDTVSIDQKNIKQCSVENMSLKNCTMSFRIYYYFLFI
jgi:hypothetical protein